MAMARVSTNVIQVPLLYVNQETVDFIFKKFYENWLKIPNSRLTF